MPILWKYLLVVAATCALAFAIAQNDAAAQTPAAQPAYGAAGPFKVEVSDATWRDAVRGRDLPVRIYAPNVSGNSVAANNRFPVILFSHGLGGNRAGGKLWAEHWAGHGYVVVAMQHGGSDESPWKDRATSDLAKNMKAGMTLGNAGLRVGDIRIPLFSVTGTEDGSILGDGTKYTDRMLPYENMPPDGKYLAVFDGGDHMVFGGHELGKRRPETARDREIQAAVKSATLAFWHATLKRDESARKWLDAGGFKSTLNAKDVFASK